MNPPNTDLHEPIDPAILYFGTPVVLLSTTNPDGSPNLAPISSAFWLGKTATIGVASSSQSHTNLVRTKEVVLCLPDAGMVDAVDRLALITGRRDVPEPKLRRGYTHHADKFTRAGLTPAPSLTVQAVGVAECPVLMECTLAQQTGVAFTLEVTHVRVHPAIRMAGTANRIDPDRWRPLIMSFQHFYALGTQVHPSRLATIDEELYR